MISLSAGHLIMFVFVSFSDPQNQWNRQSDGKGRQIPAQEVNSHKLLFSKKQKTPCQYNVYYMPAFLTHSEVRMYDPSGDSTIPSTSKKRKFEEMKEEEEAAEEPETPVVKAKKPKKEAVTEGGWSGNVRNLVLSSTVFMMLSLFLLLILF